MRAEGGFALVEILGALVFVIVVIAGGCTLAYLAFARTWLDRSAYEAAICLSTGELVRDCQAQFRQDVREALPVGHVSHVRFERSPNFAIVHGKWTLSELVTLSVDDERRLPLRVANE